jgi:hypothetical protein
MSFDSLPACFLQGIFPFVGKGIFESIAIDESLNLTVPKGVCAQVVYVRLGNHSDDLIYLTLTANDTPIRHFPVGPQGALHIPMVIRELHPPDTKLTFLLSAARGVSGTVIVDVGIQEEAFP